MDAAAHPEALARLLNESSPFQLGDGLGGAAGGRVAVAAPAEETVEQLLYRLQDVVQPRRRATELPRAYAVGGLSARRPTPPSPPPLPPPPPQPSSLAAAPGRNVLGLPAGSLPTALAVVSICGVMLAGGGAAYALGARKVRLRLWRAWLLARLTRGCATRAGGAGARSPAERR